MAKWYDPWLTSQEQKNLQVGQKGIRARQRQQEEARETRGYPKSGDRYQKQAAANNYSNSAANRGYPQSGDSAQKQAAQNAQKTQMKDISKKPELNRIGGALKDAKKNIQQQITKRVQIKRSMSERNRDRQAIEDAFKKRVRNK